MSDSAMDLGRLEDLVVATLRRFEERLLERAASSEINAILSAGDPLLVLPAPAVALAEVRSSHTRTLLPRSVFRTVEPLGTEGDVLFSPISDTEEVHPWRVERCAWRLTSDEKSNRTGFASGLRLTLARERATVARSGWLSLRFEGAPLLPWAVEHARVECRGRRLAARPGALPDDPLGTLLPRGGVSRHLFDEMTRGMLRVQLPEATSEPLELVIDLYFEESIPIEAGIAPIGRANVLPIWNSVECSYPAETSYEQATSETVSRHLHMLDPSDLGRSWSAWAVTWVGHSGGARPIIGGERPASESTDSWLKYRLVVREREPDPRERREIYGTEGRSRSRLAVLLSHEARCRLDETGRQLRARYRATTGACANGLPGGTDLQLVEFPVSQLQDPVFGELVGATSGGVDAFFPTSVDQAESVRAVLEPDRTRTVGDTTLVFSRYFGTELELIDERDLLRSGSSSAPEVLSVRVRFVRAGRAARERQAILRAAQGFLASYLAERSPVRLRLVELS